MVVVYFWGLNLIMAFHLDWYIGSIRIYSIMEPSETMKLRKLLAMKYRI